MALVIVGNDHTMKLQPGWELIEAEDDTLRASLDYVGPFTARLTTPKRGSAFPAGDPLVCHERRFKKLNNSTVKVTCDFIGIASDPTPHKIEYPGGSGTEPIETHPNFELFAGTPEAPLNGAYFDPETGEFVGFAGGTTTAEQKKRGVRTYFVPNVLVNVSYWTWRVPQARRVAREIRGGINGVITPGSVKNYLLIGLPYRQVGNLYAVTEQYMGSGENGWDTDIYN